jgi:parallel beta-helix repeat protein
MQHDHEDFSLIPRLPTNLPTERRALLAGIGGLAAGAFLAGKANAGPLTPPPGPITPTPGPEPRIAINQTNTPGDAGNTFRITQPGSYYLTGNIVGESGKNGIQIVASGVALDLCGFDLAGVPGSGSGVYVGTSDLTNITVLNGSVRNWGNSGVSIGFVSTNCRLEGVHASGNGADGIRASVGSAVIACSASSNGGRGITANLASTITSCAATSNAGDGIAAGAYNTVSHCNMYFNGVHGISCGSGCTVSYCSANSNGARGFSVLNSCIISHCVATLNAGHGIDGVGNFPGSLSAVSVTCCTAQLNSGSGIAVSNGSTVVGCIARSNDQNGIECLSACTIRNNTCSSNGVSAANGAGIRASSSDNCIDGNNCTSSNRGITVDGSGNFIVRNTCSGNTVNYQIAVNNRYGPILNISASGTLAVIGSSASGTLGSADPHANFTY